ncbi:MAG: T9SS type B sorting domain-containing protein [Bacteroidota bacterium]
MLQAQEPNDCAFAVIVCGNSNLTIDVDGVGTQELSGSNTCGSQENNSIWLQVTIATSGTLGFILTPDSSDISEDYDFFIYGPNRNCGNLGQAIRCSTTNPAAAGQGNNLTGLNATETDVSEGPGADGNSFVSELDVTAGESYFIVIDRPIGVSPFSLEWTGTAEFPENPVNPVPAESLNVEICDNLQPFNDGIAEFDVTTITNNIIATQDNIAVSYHDNVSDANIGINPLGNVFNSDASADTKYIRIQNTITGCFIINQLSLSVSPGPQFNAPSNFDVCDDLSDNDSANGQTFFDFSKKTEEITLGFNAANYNISYHSSSDDAINDVNPLPTVFYNTEATPQDIFVRIEDLLNVGCVGFASFRINVLEIPTVNNVSVFQCDEDGIEDGIVLFNLNQFYDEITGSTTGLTISFFNSLMDAQNNVNPLNNESFTNATPSQTIYSRVLNTVTGCVNFGEVTLEVSATASNDANLSICDDDGTADGLHSFDLTDANAMVLDGLPDGLTLVYYETLNDALLETNPLTNTYTNTIPFNQVIYVRVENDNECFGINEVELNVFDIPEVETEFETLYCLNDFPELITLTGGVINDIPNNFFYDWSTGATTMNIQVNEPGTYTVRVTNTDGCFSDRTIIVLPSNIATITDIQVVDAAQNNSISIFVTGEGNYEYAIDNINGPYQDSNVFENLQPGLYDVFVRDKNGCGIVDEMVSVIGFPKFFTPNGDADNNYWQVQGIVSQLQTRTPVLIFDRFGKLLVELDPLSVGWDGTYNGTVMPASDYWFTVTLADGRTFTSHFALRR